MPYAIYGLTVSYQVLKNICECAAFRLIISFVSSTGISPLIVKGKVFDLVITGYGDWAGSNNKLELDLFVFVPGKRKVEIGTVFLAQGQRSNRVALFLATEVMCVDLYYVSLTLDGIDPKADLLDMQEMARFVFIDAVVKFQNILIA